MNNVANYDTQLKKRWRFGFSNAVLINKILCDFISLTILFSFYQILLELLHRYRAIL